jgi:hypothetical protein
VSNLGRGIDNMAFYDYHQNNSGGSFSVNHAKGLSHYVIVEADSEQEANRIAMDLGLYFDGVDLGYDCSCCGDRWSEFWGDATDTPTLYGAPIKPTEKGGWIKGYNGYVHYKDGRVEGFAERT